MVPGIEGSRPRPRCSLVVADRQHRLQRPAIGTRGQPFGLRPRQVQLQQPAVLVGLLGTHRLQLVQAGAQAPGLRRQAQLAEHPLQVQAPGQGRLQQCIKTSASCKPGGTVVPPVEVSLRYRLRKVRFNRHM